eukprot:COSAG01_NODE_12119_length_1798_cov_2.046498_2_plen_222_part_00
MPRHSGGSTGGVREPLIITPDFGGGAAAAASAAAATIPVAIPVAATSKCGGSSGSLVSGSSTGMVLPAAFYCPITQEVMQDPVVALDGQSYEYAAIITWFEANQISPVTKATLRAKTLVRNFALRSTIWELVGIPGPWVEIAGCEEPIAYEEPSEALEVPPPLDGNGNEMERIGTESVGDGVAAHTSGPAAVCKAVTHSSSHPEYEELNGEYHCRCAIMRS